MAWCLGGCSTQPVNREAKNRCSSSCPTGLLRLAHLRAHQGLLSTLERGSESWDCFCPSRPPKSPCDVCSTSHSAPPCRAPSVCVKTQLQTYTLVWKALFSLAASVRFQKEFSHLLTSKSSSVPDTYRHPSSAFLLLQGLLPPWPRGGGAAGLSSPQNRQEKQQQPYEHLARGLQSSQGLSHKLGGEKKRNYSNQKTRK